MRVEAMPAPAAGALEIEFPGGVAADGDLYRRMHDGVDLGEGRGRLDIFMSEGHVDEGHLAVLARQSHRLDPALQAAAAFLDDLESELLVGLDAFGRDHFLDHLPHHVTTGDASAFVEDPILGRAHRALRFMSQSRSGLSLTPVLRHVTM